MLKFICHFVAHSESLFRSVCRTSWSLGVLISLYRMESSAKSLMFELIESVMSFMYNRKRTGPNTEP